ncbi:unnamed protein product [Vitrella brassicaformis CCMP3155]|uniref:Nucleoporin Nup133/Nup155-like N-terminal domain-containing protein n=2 Tax=Vitrella brassicaformis TaxID=1169539 RepID=A0A0G4G4M9_VITBC|nr:unnamed protein product [Vitrella brassicaformis CCMP3155]|eukprot:CEM23340.1 unnamed protein product [Vitrella brassicaformis CCMP3155]
MDPLTQKIKLAEEGRKIVMSEANSFSPAQFTFPCDVPLLEWDNRAIRMDLPLQSMLPAVITEATQRAQQRAFAGFFPFLHHLWVAVDNVLFIWNYRCADAKPIRMDFYEPLTAVELLIPRPEVFDSKVSCVVVVATEDHVEMRGLCVLPVSDRSLRTQSTTMADGDSSGGVGGLSTVFRGARSARQGYSGVSRLASPQQQAAATSPLSPVSPHSFDRSDTHPYVIAETDLVEGVYRVRSDGVIDVMAVTDDGHVFMTRGDSEILELAYQKERTWNCPRVRLIQRTKGVWDLLPSFRRQQRIKQLKCCASKYLFTLDTSSTIRIYEILESRQWRMTGQPFLSSRPRNAFARPDEANVPAPSFTDEDYDTSMMMPGDSATGFAGQAGAVTGGSRPAKRRKSICRLPFGQSSDPLSSACQQRRGIWVAEGQAVTCCQADGLKHLGEVNFSHLMDELDRAYPGQPRRSKDIMQIFPCISVDSQVHCVVLAADGVRYHFVNTTADSPQDLIRTSPHPSWNSRQSTYRTTTGMHSSFWLAGTSTPPTRRASPYVPSPTAMFAQNVLGTAYTAGPQSLSMYANGVQIVTSDDSQMGRVGMGTVEIRARAGLPSGELSPLAEYVSVQSLPSPAIALAEERSFYCGHSGQRGGGGNGVVVLDGPMEGQTPLWRSARTLVLLTEKSVQVVTLTYLPSLLAGDPNPRNAEMCCTYLSHTIGLPDRSTSTGGGRSRLGGSPGRPFRPRFHIDDTEIAYTREEEAGASITELMNAPRPPAKWFKGLVMWLAHVLYPLLDTPICVFCFGYDGVRLAPPGAMLSSLLTSLSSVLSYVREGVPAAGRGDRENMEYTGPQQGLQRLVYFDKLRLDCVVAFLDMMKQTVGVMEAIAREHHDNSSVWASRRIAPYLDVLMNAPIDRVASTEDFITLPMRMCDAVVLQAAGIGNEELLSWLKGAPVGGRRQQQQQQHPGDDGNRVVQLCSRLNQYCPDLFGRNLSIVYLALSRSLATTTQGAMTHTDVSQEALERFTNLLNSRQTDGREAESALRLSLRTYMHSNNWAKCVQIANDKIDSGLPTLAHTGLSPDSVCDIFILTIADRLQEPAVLSAILVGAHERLKTASIDKLLGTYDSQTILATLGGVQQQFQVSVALVEHRLLEWAMMMSGGQRTAKEALKCGEVLAELLKRTQRWAEVCALYLHLTQQLPPQNASLADRKECLKRLQAALERTTQAGLRETPMMGILRQHTGVSGLQEMAVYAERAIDTIMHLQEPFVNELELISKRLATQPAYASVKDEIDAMRASLQSVRDVDRLMQDARRVGLPHLQLLLLDRIHAGSPPADALLEYENLFLSVCFTPRATRHLFAPWPHDTLMPFFAQSDPGFVRPKHFYRTDGASAGVPIDRHQQQQAQPVPVDLPRRFEHFIVSYRTISPYSLSPLPSSFVLIMELANVLWLKWGEGRRALERTTGPYWGRCLWVCCGVLRETERLPWPHVWALYREVCERLSETYEAIVNKLTETRALPAAEVPRAAKISDHIRNVMISMVTEWMDEELSGQLTGMYGCQAEVRQFVETARGTGADQLKERFANIQRGWSSQRQPADAHTHTHTQANTTAPYPYRTPPRTPQPHTTNQQGGEGEQQQQQQQESQPRRRRRSASADEDEQEYDGRGLGMGNR